jgi:hypothetical protein
MGTRVLKIEFRGGLVSAVRTCACACDMCMHMLYVDHVPA